MKSYHVRMYHPFPAMRSWEHLVAIAGIVVVPLLMFVGFSLFTGIALPSVFENLGVSIYRIVTALIISIVLGWTAAVLFYHGPRSKVALPAFDVLQSLPTSATLPIATLYLGPSDATVIIFLVFTIVWPMFFTVVAFFISFFYEGMAPFEQWQPHELVDCEYDRKKCQDTEGGRPYVGRERIEERS
jgi:ABC-type nitrate/sulfonate/bicarbonate transport system permease component